MLKDIRNRKGLSQKELSELTGISIRTLQAYEQGARNIDNADMNTLISLAISLECKVTDLLVSAELIEKCSKTFF